MGEIKAVTTVTMPFMGEQAFTFTVELQEIQRSQIVGKVESLAETMVLTRYRCGDQYYWCLCVPESGWSIKVGKRMEEVEWDVLQGASAFELAAYGAVVKHFYHCYEKYEDFTLFFFPKKRIAAGSILEARKGMGYTREGLSQRLGIPRRTIEDWELGKRTPSPWMEQMVIDAILTL